MCKRDNSIVNTRPRLGNISTRKMTMSRIGQRGSALSKNIDGIQRSGTGAAAKAK